MSRALKFAVILLLTLTMLSGCKKKKPPLPPPQAQAPNITHVPQVEQPDPLPPPSPEPKTAPVKVLKPKPKPAPKKRVAKKLPKSEKKVIAKNGLEPGGLSAGVPASESNSQRRSAAQLLDAAESNLRSLKRTLRDDEQKMVQQIRSFMAQSRTAENDGDTERAYNLALKAHLLSMELVKR